MIDGTLAQHARAAPDVGGEDARRHGVRSVDERRRAVLVGGAEHRHHRRAPESFETTAEAPASTAVSSASEVRPLKSITDSGLAAPASRVIAWHVAASARLPTSTTACPFFANLTANSAKRAGGHCLADP